MRLTRVISALLGAAATPPPAQPLGNGSPAESRLTRVGAERAQRPDTSSFESAFPTQSARAALLDECVEKAKERARLTEVATRS